MERYNKKGDTMKQVKIVLTDQTVDDSYGDSYTTIIRDSITDWEEISDDDYELLKDNFWQLQKKYTQNAMLIEKDTVSVIERIASIKEWIQEERIRQEQEAAKRKAAAEEKALKRMLKKAGDEKRLLEELKKKYPDTV